MKRCVFLFSILAVYILFSGVSVSALLTDWTYLETSSPEFAGVERSLKLEPPENDLMTPETVRELAESYVLSEKSAGASSVVLFSNDSTAFDADGYYHLIQQEAVKILDPRGVQDRGTVRLAYDLPYDRTRVLTAYIIQEDGQVQYLTPEDINDVANSDDMNVNIYEPIWRSIVLTYPGVSPGSTIYWAYEHVAVKPRTPDSFQWGHTFKATDPMVSARLRLKGPVSVPVHWFVANNDDNLVQFNLSSDSMYNYMTWESGPAEMVIEEPGMIPVEETFTSLMITTDSWEQFAAREQPLIEANLEPDDAIRAKVAELTAHCKTWEEKMRSLFMYVTRRVRYMGVAYGDRPGVNPDPVTRTFANNAGVCKDKAGLLTAMLRLAGIEAQYTLNNPTRRIHQQVAVDQFNHAIVAARLPGESEWRFLDVTSDLAESMCPSSSGGTQVLRIVAEGGQPETIPVPEASANRGEFTVETTIARDGTAVTDIEYRGKGAADQYYRESFYYIDASQLKDFFSYFATEAAPSAHLDHFALQPVQLDDLSHKLQFEMSFTAPGYGVLADRFMLCRAIQARSPLDWFYDVVDNVCAIESRRYPADIGTTSQIVSIEKINLPVGYMVHALPDPIEIESQNLDFTRSWQIQSNSVIMNQEMSVKSPRISPESYQEFKDVFSEIEKSSQSYLILEVVR